MDREDAFIVVGEGLFGENAEKGLQMESNKAIQRRLRGSGALFAGDPGKIRAPGKTENWSPAARI